jgi:DNA repair protein RecO (recombination protein O)
MGIFKTNGIVVRSAKYGNSSKLVTFYSQAFGRLIGIARGARRVKSRFGAGLEPFVESEFIVYYSPDRTYQTIADSDLVRPFPAVRDDLVKSVFAYAACEALDRLTAEPSDEVYALMLEFLQQLGVAARKDAEALFWAFQLKLMTGLGYQPELAACMACAGDLPAESPVFTVGAGGILCPTCAASALETVGTVSRGTLKLLQKLRETPLAGIGRYKMTATLREEGRQFLRYFLAFHGGWRTPCRSLDSLDTLTAFEEEHARPTRLAV